MAEATVAIIDRFAMVYGWSASETLKIPLPLRQALLDKIYADEKKRAAAGRRVVG